MSNEYIIVNKSAIQKIDELVKEANAGKTISSINSQMAESLIRFKEQLLSQSTPLIPEISKAYDAGIKDKELSQIFDNPKGRYVYNLKLDI